MMYNKPVKVYKEGNLIKVDLPDNKTIEIKSTVQHEKTGFNDMNPHYFYYSDKRLGFYTGSDKTNLELVNIINQSKKKYDEKSRSFGNLAEVYNAMNNLKAHNLVYVPMNMRYVISVSR